MTAGPLAPPPPAKGRFDRVPPATALARDAFGREIDDGAGYAPPAADPPAAKKRELATETIGRRAGALSDELDFPAFVASLVHGTFDAIVDSSIRQMESFADLVAAVAKPLDQFTRENVSENQARDYLVEQHPGEIGLHTADGSPRLVALGGGGEEGDAPSPPWLAEMGLAGQPLTAELLETQVLPHARETVARQRLQTLSTLVLLGMNRVVVKDGTINARLRFRAAAADKTAFDYATGGDPPEGGGEWGRRGARTYAAPTTKVSTVGVNVQADSELKAELFGEVRINFASETLPLDRLLDEARRAQVERHARAAPAPVAAPALPAPTQGPPA